MSNPHPRPSSPSARDAKTNGAYSNEASSKKMEELDQVALEPIDPSPAPLGEVLEKTTILHLVDCLNIGGGEMQMVDLVRNMDLKKFRPIVGCLSKTGPLLPVLEQNGVRVEAFPVRGKLFYPNSLKQILRLALFIRREKVRILHTQDLYSHLVGVPAAVLADVPVITNRLDLGHTLNRWHRLALKILSIGITKAMANSKGVERMLIDSEKMNPREIELIYNGVDMERFRFASAPTSSLQKKPLLPEFRSDDRLIGTVANLLPVKGHDVLLDAAVRVVAYFPKVKFVLIGKGPRQSELEARARALSIEKHLLFLGSRQDVPDILSCMEISVLPSLAEGFSNAILESMAAGLPMVATDVGGNREAIIDGETGFIVPAGNPDILADRLLRLLEDPSLGQKMGRAGRQRIEKYFTLDRMVRETEQFYEEILQTKGRVS
jgi:glycosyltransferase involved in cell wall biosynthesis